MAVVRHHEQRPPRRREDLAVGEGVREVRVQLVGGLPVRDDDLAAGRPGRRLVLVAVEELVVSRPVSVPASPTAVRPMPVALPTPERSKQTASSARLGTLRTRSPWSRAGRVDDSASAVLLGFLTLSLPIRSGPHQRSCPPPSSRAPLLHRRSRRHGRRWANERAHGELRSLRCRYYADAPGTCQLTLDVVVERLDRPSSSRPGPLVRSISCTSSLTLPVRRAGAGQSARSAGTSIRTGGSVDRARRVRTMPRSARPPARPSAPAGARSGDD